MNERERVDRYFPSARFGAERDDEELLVGSFDASVSWALMYATDFWAGVRSAIDMPRAFELFEGDLIPCDLLPDVVTAANDFLATFPDDDVVYRSQRQEGRGPTVDIEIRVSADEIRSAVHTVIHSCEVCIGSRRDLGVSL